MVKLQLTKSEEIMQKSKVIFRKFKNEILAIFPYFVNNYNGDVTCYAHLGQHSDCDYNYVIKNSQPINKPKKLPLYNELKSIGYNLQVIKRRNYDEYLKQYYLINRRK